MLLDGLSFYINCVNSNCGARSDSTAAVTVSRGQVVFVNEQSGEYQYYEIQFRAVRPGVVATVKLSTTVRQRKQQTLTVENPLTTAVSFTATCNVADVQIPSQLSVPAQSQVLRPSSVLVLLCFIVTI